MELSLSQGQGLDTAFQRVPLNPCLCMRVLEVGGKCSLFPAIVESHHFPASVGKDPVVPHHSGINIFLQTPLMTQCFLAWLPFSSGGMARVLAGCGDSFFPQHPGQMIFPCLSLLFFLCNIETERLSWESEKVYVKRILAILKHWWECARLLLNVPFLQILLCLF